MTTKRQQPIETFGCSRERCGNILSRQRHLQCACGGWGHQFSTAVYKPKGVRYRTWVCLLCKTRWVTKETVEVAR